MSYYDKFTGLPDTFRRNVIFEAPLGAAADDWDPEANVTEPNDVAMADLLLERRRWTGPDVIRLENAVYAPPAPPPDELPGTPPLASQ